MDIAKMIADEGAAAVGRIPERHGAGGEVGFHETAIGREWRPTLSRPLGETLTCVTEEPYFVTAKKLLNYEATDDVRLAHRIATMEGGWNGIADVTLYSKSGKPAGIVEIKLFAEAGDINAVICDKRKMRFMYNFCRLPCYIALFVTDTARTKFIKRIETISNSLKENVCATSEVVESFDRKWEWCFAVWKFDPRSITIDDEQSRDIIERARLTMI